MNLFQISNEMEKLLYESLDDGEIVSPDEFTARLRELESEKKTIVLDLACVHTELLAKAAAIKQVEDQISAGRKSIMRKAEVIEKSLEEYAAGEKYDDARTTVGWSESQRTIVTIDAELLPEEFRRVKYEAMKTELKEAILEDKRSIEGVSVEDFWNLQIGKR